MKEIWSGMVLLLILLKQCVYPTPIEKFGCLHPIFRHPYKGHCYAICPKDSYVFDSRCYEKCPDNTVVTGRKCICPKGYFVDSSYCLPCSSLNAIWDEQAGKCSERCPYPLRADFTQNKCVCNEETGYIVDETGACVLDGCKDGEFRAYGICYPCSTERIFSNVEESECAKCLNREYLDGECVLKKDK